ncbi:hypothetical protein FA13DRAFT_1750753 [Coprinellus micaceus]|uniref:Uncharacterized protein n=1 Tax=Coprinellus micaceus TaxID=71717 RepID=A0A4Y7R5K2_COPMI|nr:hypothetical protein FA13DRAFT_1750753 [Coprinellus micaceus]
MVNLRTGVILTSFVSLCLVTTPVLAQTMGGGEATDGQCEVLQDSSQPAPVGTLSLTINACVSCVEGAGIDTSTVEQYDTIKGMSSWDQRFAGATRTNVTTTTTVSADTAPASTVSAPPPGRSNGAVALTGALVLGFAF